MEQAARLDYLLAEARRVDPDRYLCALFAPADRREPLLALAVLARDLARIPDMVTQPMAGLIRYQWWREAVAEAGAGRPREHPVVEALAVGLGQGWLQLEDLHMLVDAHEALLESGPATDPPALQGRLESTAGAVQAIAVRCLGATTADERQAAAKVGTALGLVHATPAAASGGMDRDGLLDRASRLLEEARGLAPRPPRELLSAFLPARLARSRARRLRRGRGAESPPLAALDLLAATIRGRY